VSDLELLFLVLVCLYGWECACWLRSGSVAFLTWFGYRWRAVFAGSVLGNRHGGFILAAPLPPLGRILTANEFPLSFSTEGALTGACSTIRHNFRPQQPNRFCRFDALQKVEVRGRKLLVNGELFLKAASPALAGSLANHLRDLAKTPVSQRAQAIDKIFRDIFDAKVVKKRWRDFQKQTWLIRWLVNALFLYLFIFVPVLIWNFGLKFWLSLLVELLALTTSIAILFHRAHKNFYPKSEDERLTHFLLILLSPVTSIRALDTLSRPLFETFHPLTVASVFCSPEQFRELAGRALRDLQFPVSSPSKDPAAQMAERDSRSSLRKALENLLKQNRLNPEELLRPPPPADESCRAYCPRCLAQFTHVKGTCPDCVDLALRAFPEPDSGRPRPQQHERSRDSTSP